MNICYFFQSTLFGFVYLLQSVRLYFVFTICDSPISDYICEKNIIILTVDKKPLILYYNM